MRTRKSFPGSYHLDVVVQVSEPQIPHYLLESCYLCFTPRILIIYPNPLPLPPAHLLALVLRNMTYHTFFARELFVSSIFSFVLIAILSIQSLRNAYYQGIPESLLRRHSGVDWRLLEQTQRTPQRLNLYFTNLAGSPTITSAL